MPGYETHLWLARKIGLLVGVFVAAIAFIGGALTPYPLSLFDLFSSRYALIFQLPRLDTVPGECVEAKSIYSVQIASVDTHLYLS